MSANAIETLGAAIDCAHPITADDHDAVEAAPDALAAVEELLEAAKALVAIEAEEDIMGTRWFAREAFAQVNLAAAVRRVESGQ